MKKLEVVMSKMFLLFRVETITGQCCDILSVLTPDSAFHSALLHSCIDNTLTLSTAVIGLYGNRGITPVIISQS